MIGKIYSDQLLSNVSYLYCNLSKLESTSQKPPNPELLVAHLVKLKKKENLVPFLNHICMLKKNKQGNFSFKPPISLNKPLIVSHYKNCKKVVELLGCPSVEGVEFLDVLNTFYRLEWSFDKFSLLYPNVRIVSFENAAPTGHIPRLLLEFLENCRALTELRFSLKRTGFHKDFYGALPTISSLRTLANLSLFESHPDEKEQIDFDSYFEAFGCLRVLFTNMVAKENAPGFLDKIRAGSTFSFQYDHRSEQFNVVQVLVTHRLSMGYAVILTEETITEHSKFEPTLVPTLDEAKGFLQKHLEKAR